jgi:DNA-binding MarR family transcriptional regulator
MTSRGPNIAAKPEERVAHHPAIGDIRDLLTFRIALIAAAADRVGQRWLSSEFDLRIMEWRVLGVVSAMQPVRFFELARELIIDKGQLSRLVGNLTRRGLVATEPDPDDQRTVRLRPTEEGAALHVQVLARALERNERVVAALEPGELETLFSLLDKLQPYMAHRAEPDGEDAAT